MIIAKSFRNTFFATTSFQFISWRVCTMVGTSTGAIGAEQRQCQSLLKMRKGVSQQQEHVNGVNANQRSDEVKYGRPI
jgi:hypothetical protein